MSTLQSVARHDILPSFLARGTAMRVIDRKGERYGRLIAQTRLPAKSKTDTNARWVCICDCGNSAVAYGQDLSRGKVKSCGCLNAERRMQHGMAHLPIYHVWQAMLQRCENPNSQSYENYGARGISVCERWHKFTNFIADVGNRPKGFSLDRIDVNGNYESANVRWASNKTQGNNKRNNNFVEFNGETKTIAEWADATGIPYDTLSARIIDYRWSPKRALTEPLKVIAKYTHDGRTLTLREWSEVTGMDLELLSARVRKLKWNISRALTTPVYSKGLN